MGLPTAVDGLVVARNRPALIRGLPPTGRAFTCRMVALFLFEALTDDDLRRIGAGAVGVANTLPAGTADTLLAVARAAFTDGMHVAAAIAAVVGIGLASVLKAALNAVRFTAVFTSKRR